MPGQGEFMTSGHKKEHMHTNDLEPVKETGSMKLPIQMQDIIVIQVKNQLMKPTRNHFLTVKFWIGYFFIQCYL